MSALRRIRGSEHMDVTIQQAGDALYKGPQAYQIPVKKHFSDEHIREVITVLKLELRNRSLEVVQPEKRD
jgi:hypothetical protein